ncbi:hypothetical protein DCAR_0520359 [Daucus carota subsp. sativus]|uniref:Uncharacterized protein n=1 Tax=Daucus carota subsp. sativus TaxID=79200 RepID=A0A162A373_DAUCS|nr:hypothetical protein DCAR_0520359 [Daucus carota subsp. sativus]
MSTGAAGDGFFKGIYDSCIPGHDMSVQNRPYHRNCGCALHKARGDCSHSLLKSRVSYPILRAWGKSKALMTCAQSSQGKNEEIRKTESDNNLVALYGEDPEDQHCFISSSSKSVNLLKYLFSFAFLNL